MVPFETNSLLLPHRLATLLKKTLEESDTRCSFQTVGPLNPMGKHGIFATDGL